MKSTAFLSAAYLVTWVILVGYILYLSARARALRDEVRELQTSQRNSADLR